jgi:UDP-N-acetylmuramate--alanine ligase
MWVNLNNVYFIGIGGIGMSALARFFKTHGKAVAGYDRTSTGLTDELMREDIDIHYIDKPALIPIPFRDPDRTLVIYTPAVPEDSHELAYFRNNGFRVIKRSVALGEVFNAGKGIAVAGTHGKTSVSTAIAFIMSQTLTGCNAFLGGISKNFNSNLLVNSSSRVIIAEADEFDRSFLTMYPKLAVITSMDADHLDIYQSKENLLKSFQDFVNQVDEKGKIILRHGLEISVPETVDVFTYSLDDTEADYHITAIERSGWQYHFTVKTPREILPDLTLGVPGLMNVENALAAIAAADVSEVPREAIISGCAEFTGVKRRFDIRVMKEDRLYIDDYAHHPEEIRFFLHSVKELWSDRKLTGIFQPHLYSRTRDFAAEFAKSLSMLDELILLDIYPAREQPIEGVDAALIFDQVEIKEKVLIKKDQLVRVLRERDPEVLLTMGAGDIDTLVEPLTSWMNSL